MIGKPFGIALATVFLAWSLGTSLAEAQGQKQLVIVTTGGAFEQGLKKHFYEPFEKATGIRVVPVAANSLEQFTRLKAMNDTSRVEFDIVSGGPASGFQFRDLLIDIDCKRLRNLGKALKGSCEGNGLLRTFGGFVIAYDTRAFTSATPKNYADFWDVKRFPGPRGVINAGVPQWTLAVALLADGVAPAKLFPMDLDRAFRKLDEIKPHVKVWWKTGDQSQQIMRDGEVVINLMWSGRAITLRKQGLPIAISWQQSVKDYATWHIAKNTPNLDGAYAFLDFFLGHTDGQVAFALEVNNSTSSAEGAKRLPEAEKANFAATYWDDMVDIDGNAWVQENRELIVKRWNEWIAK